MKVFFLFNSMNGPIKWSCYMKKKKLVQNVE